MSKTIYKFTRQLSMILTTVTSVLLFYQGYYFRFLGNIVLLVLFLLVSHLYQKRFNIITTSYIFIFINLYIVFSLVASYYDCAKIIKLDATGFQNWGRNDYYPIYFFSAFFAYIWILIYLKYCCKTKRLRMSDISFTKIQIRNVYIGIALTCCIYFLLGRYDIIILPALAMILILAVIDRTHRLLHVCTLLIFSVLFRSIFFTRFYVVQIVFPAIIVYFMSSKKNESKYSIFRLYFYFTIGVLLILFYGVISETIKLNLVYGGNNKLIDNFTSRDRLLLSFLRQIYRIFIIWIKDGGYIIYHVQKNGFYYGLSYLKPLAGFLGLPYINLPQIAAEYNYSTYSQTGLLAEGYSNFGIIGATINIVLVFFFMECLKDRFVSKPSIMTISFVTIPFSKVILDGGSLSSCIVLSIVLLLVYFLNILANFCRR